MLLAQIHGVDSPSHTFTYLLSNLLPSLIVQRILLFSLFIAGFIFLVRLILAGFSYLTAAGEPAKIKSATQSLTNALIGLIVVTTAFFIAQIIEYTFGINIL